MEVNKEETDQIKHQRKNTNGKEKNTLNRAKEIQPSSRPSSKWGTWKIYWTLNRIIGRMKNNHCANCVRKRMTKQSMCFNVVELKIESKESSKIILKKNLFILFHLYFTSGKTNPIYNVHMILKSKIVTALARSIYIITNCSKNNMRTLVNFSYKSLEL